MTEQKYKFGNEFLPFHRQASHVNPDYRDGWNACFAAALSHQVVQPGLTSQEIREMWASENGLEDCLMCKLDDFEKVVRAIESALAAKTATTGQAGEQANMFWNYNDAERQHGSIGPAVAAIPDGLRDALELVICESEAQCGDYQYGCVRCDATALLRKHFSLSAAPTKEKS
jgi:hypothetical protein